MSDHAHVEVPRIHDVSDVLRQVQERRCGDGLSRCGMGGGNCFAIVIKINMICMFL